MANYFPFAVNYRRYDPRQIGPRPPLTGTLFTAASQVVTLARLNDTTPLGPGAGFAIVSQTTPGNLYVGSNLVGSGFSGSRCSMVSYRPSASVQPFIYIGDTAKMGKTTASATGPAGFFNMGIAEPQQPATAQIGGTQFDNFTPFWDSFSPFGTGSLTSPAANRVSTTMQLLFDNGTTGEASMIPGSSTNIAPDVALTINSQPTLPIVVESAQAAPTNTTIGTITYDSGSTGLCTIVTSSAVSAAANEVYQLGGTIEPVRIISVIPGPGTNSTIRCKTVFNHVGGQAMTGLASFRVVAPFGNFSSNILKDDTPRTQLVGAGTGGIQMVPAFVSGSMVQGRTVQPTDTLHFLIQVDTPANITSCTITFNLDPNIVDFTTNALQWVIAGGSFTAGGVWLDIAIPVSSLTRLGTNTALSIDTGINGIQIKWATTGNINPIYDRLIVIGSYGPTVTGSEQGIFYRYKYRASATGAVSNPSPPMRTSLNSTGTSNLVQGTPSADPQVDTLDWYRFGAALLNYTYVGSSPNTTDSFVDTSDDASVSGNPLMTLDDYQPFPSIDLPASGTCSVSGNNVFSVSGTPFNIRWGPGTQIIINGNVYTLYNRPTSTSQLQIFEDGGSTGVVPFTIAQPILLAQPLPALWGPTDNAGYFFAVGDPLRAGTLYFTKGNNPDSAPQGNTIEITSPSEPLMNGCIVNGLAMVFSTERAWWIYPNFANVVSTITGIQGNPFYPIESINDRGLYARFGLATDGGGNVFFIAKDGIYKATGGGGSKSITESIYSMFPHEGSQQQSITINGVTVNPPDFTNPNGLLLTFVDGRLYFDYYDVGGNPFTLVFDNLTGMWSQDLYTPTVTSHAPPSGVDIGTYVGCQNGTIRQLSPSGTEVVACTIQNEEGSYGAPGFQHISEFNAEYAGTLSVAFLPDQGQVPGTIALATQSTQQKTFQTVGANKFKLMAFILTSTTAFRFWVDEFQVKIGTWNRSDDYEVIKPLEMFAATRAEAKA